MNNLIISQFEKLIDYTRSEIKNDRKLSFKIKHFIKALDILKSITFKINSSQCLKGIPGIGNGILKRVDEIINTGSLSELPNNDESVNIISDLLRVTGIGPSKAIKLKDQKINLNMILSSPNDYDLNHHQLIGVKYFNDFENLIPRREIISLEKKINKIINKLDKDINIHICGSYRREKPTSGDIDILLTHEYLEDNQNLLKQVVNTLKENNIIIDDLTTLGKTKYMGVCKNSPKGKARRIDIRYIPKKSLACALLYFTGSGEFNVKMRQHAIHMNFTLNEYNLRKKTSSNYKIIDVESERDIFDYLKLNYVEPKDRTPDYKLL